METTMIDAIVTGTGTSRRVHSLPNAKQERYALGQHLKNALFPTPGQYGRAKQRGKAAKVGAV